MATVKKAEEGKKLAKATPADTVAKVEAVKKAAAKEAEAAKKAAAPKAEAKPAAKKAAAPKTEAKPAAKKAAAPKAEAKPAAKKAAAPKAETKSAAKKPAAKKAPAKAAESVFIEFAGGQIEVAALIEKAKESVGKKAVKELNVYYQPETGMVYYTADGEAGSYKL